MNNIVKSIFTGLSVVGTVVGAYKLGRIIRGYTAKKDIQKFQKAFDKKIEDLENQKSELEKKCNAAFEDWNHGSCDETIKDYPVMRKKIMELTGKIEAFKYVRDINVEVD